MKPYYLYNLIAFFRSDITKSIGIGLGPAISYASSGVYGESNSGIALSLFVDVLYKFSYKKYNMAIGIRAQEMPIGVLDPPIDGGGSGEIAGIYFNLNMPITIRY